MIQMKTLKTKEKKLFQFIFYIKKPNKKLGFFCSERGARSPDLWVMNPTL